MKRLRIVGAILGLAITLAGCPRVQRVPTPTTETSPTVEPSPAMEPHQPILAVVRAQVDAMNKENLEGAVAVVDPASPTMAQTRQFSEELFRTYDLRYTLSEMAVDSVKGDEARVRFTQTTERISGPPFRDNRIEGVHILKKQQDGGWKILMTQAGKIDYLENHKP